MKFAVCDDDKFAYEQLEEYIFEFFGTRHLKKPELEYFQDGESLLCSGIDMDVLFLDIEMPGVDGIFIGNELKRRNPELIILVISAYPEYLDDAMRFHVFRYLTKPLEEQRLYRNLEDVLTALSSACMKVAIETKQRTYTVSTSEIIYIEAQGKKVYIQTATTKYESTRTIQTWLEILPHTLFFQTHRSYIVNLQHVCNFDHTLVYLANNTFQAYLTRRRYKEFKEAYLIFLESAR